MTELTHHDADDGFHEIQLSGKQVVFAFMLTTAAAVFIFLLGVQVGRNAKTPARTDEPVEMSAAAPSTTTPPPTTPSTSSSGSGAAQPGTSATAGQNPKWSYPALGSDGSVPEKLKPNSEDAPQAAPAAATPRTSEPKEAKKPEEPKETAAKPAAKAPPVEDHPAPAKAAPPAGARPGVWVVQLVALKDRGAANAVVQRLSAKGYPAFVVSPSPGAPSIYRVQVGRYNDRREAEQVARRLEKEEQFKPWISH